MGSFFFNENGIVNRGYQLEQIFLMFSHGWGKKSVHFRVDESRVRLEETVGIVWNDLVYRGFQ